MLMSSSAGATSPWPSFDKVVWDAIQDISSIWRGTSEQKVVLENDETIDVTRRESEGSEEGKNKLVSWVALNTVRAAYWMR